MDESHNESDVKDNIESFAFRHGHIFVVDAAPEMFECDPEADTTYFKQCLNLYGSILSQKLAWNKRDWMGLILYNATKNSRWNPDGSNILTMCKFAEASSDDLHKILEWRDFDSNEGDCRPSKDADLDRCLDDVLWQACRLFDCIKIAMPIREVVLLTRRDNPLPEDTAERHKIRLRAKTYRDVNITLRIIGLGKTWNHELFYKDLDVLANNVEPEESKPTKLEDLELWAKFPARTSGHLKWRLGQDVEIPLVVSSFSSKTKYLHTARMHMDTNEILEAYRHWGPTGQGENDSSDEEDEDIVSTHIPDNVVKAVKCGGKSITFRLDEIKDVRVTSESGVDLIGFKPIDLSLIYHIKPPRFVTFDTIASNEEKALFAALLTNCQKKNVMAICAVSHRAATYLARMIPCPKYGGFYLYQTAFKEQVNDLGPYTHQHIYDSVDEQSLPTEPAGVNLMTRIIKKLRIAWDPFAFVNPKLVRQLAYIEALALDLPFAETLDATLPDEERIKERLGDLVQKFEALFGLSAVQAVKREPPKASLKNTEKMVRVDDELLRSLIKSGKLKELKVESLRVYARSIGEQTTGLKAQLVQRITEYYAKKDAECSA